jgi:hypothetical protein
MDLESSLPDLLQPVTEQSPESILQYAPHSLK